MAANFNIPPDAVKVWRGYRASSLQLSDFLAKLGSVFVPATVEMQIAAGLCAYVPAVPAGLPNKPDSVPDETAILFWESQQTYTDAFEMLAVRTYTLTHGPVYRAPSTATFPVLFAGTLKSEQPYFLVNRPADWMHGQVTHLMGSRPASVTPDAFGTKIAAALSAIQAQGKVAGAIACAGDDYLVYWELAGTVPSNGVETLKACLDWSQGFAPAPNRLSAGLWDQWPGMTVASGATYNMQFTRRWEHLDDKVRPTDPGAAHVWRGVKLPSMSFDDFRADLGTVFVPTAALIQPPNGLYAYVPTIMPGPNTAGMPDQTALMFWASEAVREASYGTVGERAYKGLHASVFAGEPPSQTGNPIVYPGTIIAEQPYYLLNQPADWMLGTVRHFFGGVPAGQSADAFLQAVTAWTGAYQKAPTPSVDAAIICAGNTYVAFWEHAPPGVPDNGAALASLAKVSTPVLSKTAENYVPPSGLWDQWPGIDLSVHECMNIQLDRRTFKPIKS
jgi:hypothetical protein